MDNYIALVFDDDTKAYKGLHALWKLDHNGEVTVHGAAVIHRDAYGYIDVAAKDSDVGMRTALGIGIGVLLGALAGPVGAAVGAAAGGVVGVTADAMKDAEHGQAQYEAGFVLPRGKSAVIAEVSEDSNTSVDMMAQRQAGAVYRRAKDQMRKDTWDWDYSDYLYPYDYQPAFT